MEVLGLSTMLATRAMLGAPKASDTSTDERFPPPWPELLRWLATRHPPLCERRDLVGLIARGAPVGAPRGFDPDDRDRPGSLLSDVPEGELYLVTGFLDDNRKAIACGDRMRWLAEFAYLNRDHWTDQEHAEFFVLNLDRWPFAAGRDGDREALALGLLLAEIFEVDVDAIIRRMGRKRASLERRDVFDVLNEMRNELEAPKDLRLPRVMTELEYEARPRLPLFVNVRPRAFARAVDRAAENGHRGGVRHGGRALSPLVLLEMVNAVLALASDQ